MISPRFSRARVLFAVASVLTAAWADPPASNEWQLPPALPALKPGPGLSTVQSACFLCHSDDYITTQPKLTRRQWQAEVDKMRVRFGAPISTNLNPTLVDYLTTYYGKTENQ